MGTLLLDRTTWDLVLDTAGNIAVASRPYAQAQDAASAIKTFLGECYWDTTIGVPYLQEILAKNPPLTLVKAQLNAAAETAEGVATAQTFVTSLANRRLSGQVQVTLEEDAQVAAADFSVVSPQGAG